MSSRGSPRTVDSHVTHSNSRYKLPIRVFAKLNKSVQDGAKLVISSANSRVGSVQAHSTSKRMHEVSLDDGSECCNYQVVRGIPCRHQARLCAALKVDPVSLVREELTVAHDAEVFKSALPVRPVATTGDSDGDSDVQLEEDSSSSTAVIPAPPERRRRGRPRLKRIRGAIDREHRRLKLSQPRMTSTVTEPVEDKSSADEQADPPPKKRRVLRCSKCQNPGHNARSCSSS